MKSRDLSAWLAAACICTAAGASGDDKLPLDGSVDNNTLAARFLSSVYGDYDKQRGCWIATADDQDFEYQYCMKPDRVDAISSNTGKRLYILAAGDLADPSTGGHVSSGLIGAFVLEDHNGHTDTIAANDKILAGSFGASPKKWQFVRLGPSDYWGWQNSNGYTAQGLTVSTFMLLAPFGKGVRDLAKNLPAGRDDSGMDCPEGSKDCGGTAWTAQLSVDSSGSDSVYPLQLTVSGTSHGKDLKQKIYKVPFERKTWSFQKPDDPLFKEP
jgi:hypothetical protein